MAARTGSTSGKNLNVSQPQIRDAAVAVEQQALVAQVEPAAAAEVPPVALLAAVLAVAALLRLAHHQSAKLALNHLTLKHLHLLPHPLPLPNKRSSKELGREPSAVA
jgi:hypothetical protein